MGNPVLHVSGTGMKLVSEALFPENPEAAEMIAAALFGDDLPDDILSIDDPFVDVWRLEGEITSHELERGATLKREPSIFWAPPMVGFAPAAHFVREQAAWWAKSLNDTTAVIHFLQSEGWSPDSDVDPVFRAFWTSADARLGWSGESVPVSGLAPLVGDDVYRYMSKESNDAHQSATRKADVKAVATGAPQVRWSGNGGKVFDRCML